MEKLKTLAVSMLPDAQNDTALSIRMCLSAIDEVRKRGDSCGGEVTCVVRNTPMGLGSPVFDKLEAALASAVMSLPATKAKFWSPFDSLWCCKRICTHA